MFTNTGEAEEQLCFAKGQSGGFDAVCLLVRALNAGDQLYTRFKGSGHILLIGTQFQATFLYNTN